MTTQSPGKETASAATAQNAIGWVLAGTAFLFTAWSGLQTGNATMAGQRVGQLFATWLIMTLVAWLFTRTGTPSTRAYGRIAVALLLWLVVGFNMRADVKEKAVGQAFLRDAVALSTVQTQKFQALNERFTRADLSNVLTPASVTSAGEIAKGRAQVAQFRDLVAARDALIRQNMEEIRSLVANLPAGPTKSGAQASVGTRRDEAVRVFKELSATQLAHLDMVTQVLDWCAAQDGKIRNVDGHLKYASHEQAAELKTLLDKLAVAAAAADKAFGAANQIEQQAEQQRVKSIKQATELLK